MVARLDNAGLRALLDSPNWREFVRCLSDGMRLSLSIYRGQERILAPGPRCPWCDKAGDGLGECTGYMPRHLAVAGEPVVVVCARGIPHAVCHLAGEQILDVVYMGPVAGAAVGGGLPEISNAELQSKARSARTIIAGMVMAYFAANTWGRRGLEMTAIQEISRTIISLLRFGNPELDKALDLVVNTLMILLDADACWLVTSEGLVISRGIPVDAHGLLQLNAPLPAGALECPVGKGGEWGRLGVQYPTDREWAVEVLAQLADQVQIVLEVDRLHRAAQHQMGMLLEALDGAVLITDGSGRIKAANGTAERLLQRRAADLFGHDADTALPMLAGAVLQTLHSGRRREGMGQTGVQGREPYLEWTTAPLQEAGSIGGCLVVVRDRTEAHEQRQQWLKVQNLSLAGQLAAGVAREIYHPLAAVRSLLERTAGPKGLGAGDLERALTALDRAHAVIEVFLQMAQTGARVRGPVDLVQLVREAAALLAPEAELQGVDLRVQVALPVLPVWGTAAELLHVARQLCRNAIQAMPEGGSLVLRATSEEGWVRLCVQDTGEGIAPDDVARVFDPFFTTRPGGLGLGLFLCRAVIQAHGGRIQIESRAGQGTGVTVWLPGTP